MLPFVMPLLWTLAITVGDFKGIIIYLLSLANFTSDFLKNHYILLSFYTLYFTVPLPPTSAYSVSPTGISFSPPSFLTHSSTLIFQKHHKQI